MSLETLLLLRQILLGQQLSVGDPGFATTAPLVLTALVELDAAIAVAQASPISAED
jgi:hypothetical protein